ncbi:unnamed protein product [Rotaria sp. Silwood2]|nr:unnamed protein product [Rotaria sp. Silwood2]
MISLDTVLHEPLPTNVAVQIHYRENQTHSLQLCIELLITQDVPHFRFIANECGGSTSADITQNAPIMDTFLCMEPVYNW